MAILRHVFVYFAWEKNSFFFFFFSEVEKHEFTYYFMAELNFNLYLYVLGKKLGDMTSICLMSPFLEATLSSFAKFIHLLSKLSEI